MNELRQIAVDVDVHRLIEQNRASFGESENDILRRLLLSGADGVERRGGSSRTTTRKSGTRSRGNWSVVIGADRFPAANLKDAYYIFLRQLAERVPGFIEAFAQERSGSRLFVAQTPQHLYPTAPHLVRDFACTLVDGWYYDSNLSSAQVARRARIAARICGLHYGADVKILDNFREI